MDKVAARERLTIMQNMLQGMLATDTRVGHADPNLAILLILAAGVEDALDD